MSVIPWPELESIGRALFLAMVWHSNPQLFEIGNLTPGQRLRNI